MEGSKKYLPVRRKKEAAGRVFAASEEVSEQHTFSLYKWEKSKEYCFRRFGATHSSHAYLHPVQHLRSTPYPVSMLTKSGCATVCVTTHCAKFLAQQIHATCQLPVELCPYLWRNTNKNRPPDK